MRQRGKDTSFSLSSVSFCVYYFYTPPSPQQLICAAAFVHRALHRLLAVLLPVAAPGTQCAFFLLSSSTFSLSLVRHSLSSLPKASRSFLASSSVNNCFFFPFPCRHSLLPPDVALDSPPSLSLLYSCAGQIAKKKSRYLRLLDLKPKSQERSMKIFTNLCSITF